MVAISCVGLTVPSIRRGVQSLVLRLGGKHTVENPLQEFSTAVSRVRSSCTKQGVQFSPERLVLIAVKAERQLEVFAGAAKGSLRWIADYPIYAAIGQLGPKLNEGDREVLEGVYAIGSLNPNSRFHVAFRINYPSEADRAFARQQNRTNLGGDIMIHGGNASVGRRCHLR